jgi:hypothetical protein
MIAVPAHLAGLPVEETVLQIASAGIAAVAAGRLARERARCLARSIARRRRPRQTARRSGTRV